MISEWKTIDSAPKGVWLLTCNTKSGFPEVEETMWIARRGESFWTILLDGQSCQPTHWTELPPLPGKR